MLLHAKRFTCFTSTSSCCLFSIFTSYLIINSVDEKNHHFKAVWMLKKIVISVQLSPEIWENIASLTVQYYSVSLVADNPF